MEHIWRRRAALIPALILGAGVSAGQKQPSKNLTDISLEELMNVEVTSVSKKEQRLSRVPAAVFVITQEDIRRSGATAIPDLLRMVPGMQVARINSSAWAVSARGFNGRWSNKLLVLIDGRSVYDPLYSGVNWDAQDTLLEDIERIEVIRGPGATVWGANAVNGVINIMTRHARDTQGALVTAAGGNDELAAGAVRYGGRAGPAYYRLYSKYFRRNHLWTPSGQAANGRWDAFRTAFRVDWDVSRANAVRLHGDLYHGDADEVASVTLMAPPYRRTFGYPTDFSGGSLLGRWEHVFSERSDAALQVYFDRTRRDLGTIREHLDTWDLEFQHRRVLGSRHEILLGFEGRLNIDAVYGQFGTAFSPGRRRMPLLSGFVQDEIAVVEDRLRLTLGLKLEHNLFTSVEVQPSAQILWTPQARHALWASAARAVRTPSRSEHDARFNVGVFPGQDGVLNVVSLFGNAAIRSEELLAYEAGYRVQAARNLSLDLATFYNVYSDLQNTRYDAPYFESLPAPPHLVFPIFFCNQLAGEGYGAELAAHWAVNDRWKLSPGYSWLRLQLHQPAGARSPDAERAETESPRHQAQLRSALDLPGNASFDTALYYNGALSAWTVGLVARRRVPAYARIDARLGWRPARNLEFSLALQNLLDRRHLEFIDRESGSGPELEVGRGIELKLTWRLP